MCVRRDRARGEKASLCRLLTVTESLAMARWYLWAVCPVSRDYAAPPFPLPLRCPFEVCSDTSWDGDYITPDSSFLLHPFRFGDESTAERLCWVDHCAPLCLLLLLLSTLFSFCPQGFDSFLSPIKKSSSLLQFHLPVASTIGSFNIWCFCACLCSRLSSGVSVRGCSSLSPIIESVRLKLFEILLLLSSLF
ncbi:hypothetical protein SAY87_028924 [Trapa incisa]|uniref:Uncharacterized protein n=1 Tax=Trapa incisa TaxID=236973 RepID=A0AAN7L2Q5_9MYRT|nr:hypothetical protein SAY87_028924 [Trapa incisa]